MKCDAYAYRESPTKTGQCYNGKSPMVRGFITSLSDKIADRKLNFPVASFPEFLSRKAGKKLSGFASTKLKEYKMAIVAQAKQRHD